jgi:hypothetical protein
VHYVEIKNRFAALVNLDDQMDINRVGKLLQNFKISEKQNLRCYGLRKHNPRFNKESYKIFKSKERSQISADMKPAGLGGEPE